MTTSEVVKLALSSALRGGMLEAKRETKLMK
jgi:hypothetical protein